MTQSYGFKNRLDRFSGFLAQTGRRSASNFRQTYRLIRARRHNRPGSYPAWPWFTAAWSSICAIAIAAAVLDAPVGNYRGSWPEGVLRAAVWTTDAALGGWYIVPAVIVLVIVNMTDWSKFGGKRLLFIYNWTAVAMFAAISVGLSGLLAAILKQVIGRARPIQFGDNGVFFFDPLSGDSQFASFPSGHATTVGALAVTIMLLVPGSRFIVIPVAAWIAGARILVGAHYPSDILGGLALGSAFTLVTAVVFARLGYVFVQRGLGLPAPKRTLSLLPPPRRGGSARRTT